MAKSKKGDVYIVAMYYPPGNVVRKFKENVEKPTLKYEDDEDYEEKYNDEDEYEYEYEDDEDKDDDYDDEEGKWSLECDYNI